MKNYGISFDKIKSSTAKPLTEFQKQRIEEDKIRNKTIDADLAAAIYYVGKVESSKTRGLSFRLTYDEVRNMCAQEKCAYTGQLFTETGPMRPTMERINPEIGYEPGNVVMITSAANSHKSNLDAFIKQAVIGDEMKLKLLRKAAYQLEKKLKGK